MGPGYAEARDAQLCEPQIDADPHRWDAHFGKYQPEVESDRAHDRTRDVEVGGKTIKQGDRVVMWYISGNRDDAVIENPGAFIIDRERPRHHMSFGFGVHRCVGNRVAEMQLTIIWEEILKRFPVIELVGKPVRTFSSFVHGFESMQVVIPARA